MPVPTPPHGPPPFSWFPVLGAIGDAGRLRSLLLAVAGLLLTFAGWSALDAVSGGEREGLPPTALSPLPTIERFDGPDPIRIALYRSALTILAPLRVVAGPIVGMLAIDSDLSRFVRSLLMALWGLLVWGLFGGAIGRSTIERLDPIRERSGVRTTVRFVGRRLGAILAAPVGLLVLVGLLATPAAMVGLLSRLGVPGSDLVFGVGLGPILLLAIPAAVVVVFLVIGWPLMVLTVAIEGEDAFDAVGRSFNYLTRRAGTFAGSVLLAWLGGAIGLLLASQFARLVLHLAGWGMAISAGGSQIAPEFSWSSSGRLTAESLTPGVWLPVVGFLLLSWSFSYFWSAFARIYVLLRFEVDGTSWPDLSRPEDDLEPFAPDPPTTDPS